VSPRIIVQAGSIPQTNGSQSWLAKSANSISRGSSPRSSKVGGAQPDLPGMWWMWPGESAAGPRWVFWLLIVAGSKATESHAESDGSLSRAVTTLGVLMRYTPTWRREGP
jgi:hypothetical protein